MTTETKQSKEALAKKGSAETVTETTETTEVKTPKHSPDELAEIFDKILFEGEYTEEIKIRNKLVVVFKSRSAKETQAISLEIDSKNFTLYMTAQEHRALLNLASSLVNYAGKDLSKVTAEDRKTFVGKLPTSVVAKLSEELVKFDLKVDAACRDSEENF